MSPSDTSALESNPPGGLSLPSGGASRTPFATAALLLGVLAFSLGLGGLAVLKPLFAIAAVAGAAVVIAVLLRPEIATPLTLFLVYASVPAVAINSQGVPQAVGAVVPFLLVIPAAYYLLQGESVILDRNLGLLLLLMAAGVASSLNALDQTVAFKSVLTLALEGIITYVLVVNVVRTTDAIRLAIWTLLGVGIMLAGLSLIQVTTGTYDLPYGGFALIGADFFRGLTDTPRLAGPLGDSNYYAQIMAALLPLALLRVRAEESRPLRLLAGATVVLLLATIGLTYSRGAALALVAVLALVVALRFVRLRHAMIAFCAIAVLVAVTPEYRDRITSIKDVASATSAEGDDAGADESIRARWTETRAAALAFAENPILGLGPQNFPLHYQDYARRIGTGIHTRVRFGASRGEIPEREAHNIFVGFAADLGLAGLVLFLAILWTAMSRLVRLWRDAVGIDPEVANYAGSFLLALVAYLISGVFLTLAFERYLWLLIALASATTIVGAKALRARSAASMPVAAPSRD